MLPPKKDDYEYQERVAIRLESFVQPTQEQIASAQIEARKEIAMRKNAKKILQ